MKHEPREKMSDHDLLIRIDERVENMSKMFAKKWVEWVAKGALSVIAAVVIAILSSAASRIVQAMTGR